MNEVCYIFKFHDVTVNSVRSVCIHSKGPLKFQRAQEVNYDYT